MKLLAADLVKTYRGYSHILYFFFKHIAAETTHMIDFRQRNQFSSSFAQEAEIGCASEEIFFSCMCKKGSELGNWDGRKEEGIMK